MKPIYVAGYHQSVFGKLLDSSLPDIVRRAVLEVCGSVKISPTLIDVGSIGAVCNVSLQGQGLLASLVASVPGLEGKPIEAVENACASGGQAILSVIQKLQIGVGDVGICIGLEKMRDPNGRADGEQVGRALGYFSHPDDRSGKVYVFPHIFAEIMRCYMTTYNVLETDLAQIAVLEYANARHNPCAQMSTVSLTLEQAVTIDSRNRYIVDGLPLKTYDCSQNLRWLCGP